MADMYIKNMAEFVKTWILGILGVADYKYVNKLGENKMADPIWRTYM